MKCKYKCSKGVITAVSKRTMIEFAWACTCEASRLFHRPSKQLVEWAEWREKDYVPIYTCHPMDVKEYLKGGEELPQGTKTKELKLDMKEMPA
jgi:hypothetical protein